MRHRRQLTTFSYGIVASLLLGALMAPAASAATGDAYFVLSPTSGSYQVNGNFTLTISEWSSASDNTNAVQINMSYPANLLQPSASSATITGPFTLCVSNQVGGGSVDLSCAVPAGTASGTTAIAQITFKAIATGTATVAINAGSDIDNTSGTSVWNGTLPKASYTLTTATSTSSTPTPTSPSPTTKPAPKTGTSTSPTSPTSTSPTAGQMTAQPVTPPAASGSLALRIVNAKGQPINNAKVTLNGKQTRTTNKEGVASFSALPSATYQVSVSAPGYLSKTTHIKLAAGANAIDPINLTANPLDNPLFSLVPLGIVVIALLIRYVTRRRHYQPPVAPTPDTPPAPTDSIITG